jgi:hypothetical protein
MASSEPISDAETEDSLGPDGSARPDGRHPGSRGTLSPLLPWLLALCLVCFLGLILLGGFEALGGASLLARATPTPAFLPGTEVRLVQPGYGSVTVWQVGDRCEPGHAYGEVLSGSEARILEGVCYQRQGKTIYYRIALTLGARGWVDGEDLVRAAEYTPPTSTATPSPEPGADPTARPTAPPTLSPVPQLLPVGSPLTAGTWVVGVDRVGMADVLSSPAGDKQVIAEGRFLLVYLTATNRGYGPGTLHASSVYVEDAGGMRYGNHNAASAYASSPDCSDYALDVSPGESVCLVAALDVPTDVGDLVLSLNGAGESVWLDLP